MVTLKITVVCVGAVWLSVAALSCGSQIWRNDGRDLLDGLPRWVRWMWGRHDMGYLPLWLRRTMPSSALWFPIVVLGSAIGIALGHLAPTSVAERLVGDVAAGALVMGTLLSLSVALFGRPRAVVPPALRKGGRPGQAGT